MASTRDGGKLWIARPNSTQKSLQGPKIRGLSSGTSSATKLRPLEHTPGGTQHHKIEDALIPIRRALEDLQTQHNATQDKLSALLHSTPQKTQIAFRSHARTGSEKKKKTIYV